MRGSFLRALFVLAILMLSVSAAGATRTGPPPGLTTQGRLVWSLEALLRDTFGSRTAFIDSRYDFACAGNCFPAARWQIYVYTFMNARHSSFHLVSRSFRLGAFGNYPVPLRVHGLYIACTPSSTTFLIAYGDTVNFGLGCLRPTS